MADAKRDSNYIPTLIAVSNADGTTPVTLYADPTTHRLLVSQSGTLDDLTDVTITSAATADILYYAGTAWVNLAAGTSGQFLKTNGTASAPQWATPTSGAAGSDTQVQFNDGGTSLGGDSGFTYNKTSDIATITGISSGSATITSLTSGTARITGTATIEQTVNATAFIAQDGAEAFPAFRFASEPSMGMHRKAAGVVDLGAATQVRLDIFNGGSVLNFTSQYLAATPDNTVSLGTASATYSDLLLGDGATINFNAADVLLTHSANTLTLSGGNLALGANNLTLTGSIAATGARSTKGWFTDLESTNAPTVSGAAVYYTGGTDVALADGGTGASLTDPNADRIMFWDDSQGAVDWLVMGAGLVTTGTTMVVGTATVAQVNAGVNGTAMITPDALAGSNFGIRVVEIQITGTATAMTLGDGAAIFRIPSTMNGMKLTALAAQVYTAGTTNAAQIQIRNKTAGYDILSTKLFIDSAEVDSSTAATAYVINTGSASVSTGQLIAVDVDAVHGSAASGLVVELQFILP